MRLVYKILLVAITLTLSSCKNNESPNYEFMPNMYESVGYEAYSENGLFENNQAALIPVEGTIPRGYSLYQYEDSNAGYDTAKVNLKNPLESNEVNMAKAKELYDIYCGVCHGNNGDGKGILFKREKILGIPSYLDEGRDITEGSVYHVIYYGRNTMGSYANQLNEKERWLVTSYVMKLKSDLK
ncbi:MAG: cytochrome c, partial [Bacteroidetes bacterium]|nr:cytochrome c [Bacteroidota bacterium]